MSIRTTPAWQPILTAIRRNAIAWCIRSFIRARCPLLGGRAAAGALGVKGASETRRFSSNEVVPVPGRPVALHTPGDTRGHCMFHLPERGVMLTGDALVMLDPYTGQVGPQIVASAATQTNR